MKRAWIKWTLDTYMAIIIMNTSKKNKSINFKIFWYRLFNEIQSLSIPGCKKRNYFKPLVSQCFRCNWQQIAILIKCQLPKYSIFPQLILFINFILIKTGWCGMGKIYLPLSSSTTTLLITRADFNLINQCWFCWFALNPEAFLIGFELVFCNCAFVKYRCFFFSNYFMRLI